MEILSSPCFFNQVSLIKRDRSWCIPTLSSHSPSKLTCRVGPVPESCQFPSQASSWLFFSAWRIFFFFFSRSFLNSRQTAQKCGAINSSRLVPSQGEMWAGGYRPQSPCMALGQLWGIVYLSFQNCSNCPLNNPCFMSLFIGFSSFYIPFFTYSLVLPRVTTQANDLNPGPYFRVCLGGIQKKANTSSCDTSYIISRVPSCSKIQCLFGHLYWSSPEPVSVTLGTERTERRFITFGFSS